MRPSRPPETWLPTKPAVWKPQLHRRQKAFPWAEPNDQMGRTSRRFPSIHRFVRRPEIPPSWHTLSGGCLIQPNARSQPISDTFSEAPWSAPNTRRAGHLTLDPLESAGICVIYATSSEARLGASGRASTLAWGAGPCCVSEPP
jgi:hypothetical protein